MRGRSEMGSNLAFWPTAALRLQCLCDTLLRDALPDPSLEAGQATCGRTALETVLLDAISYRPDLPQLLQALHLETDSEGAGRVARLAADAAMVARPKALYTIAFVDEKGDDFVVIDGRRFSSRVLRVNLNEAHRVFAYVATCGREVAQWASGVDDLLERFWVDTIMEQALRSALEAVGEDVERRFAPGPTSDMNPGSLPDWPMAEQQPLFALLGDPEAAIGVSLSDSYLMVPIKSVSGLRFPTSTRFSSCQLCPRPRCPGRRAEYDAELFEKRYRSTSGGSAQ